MNLQELQKSIEEIRKFSKNIAIEISGGINLDNIQNYRNFDIDFISIGSLTNSAKIVDIGLDFL
jgi:nicotinate-nucleotide pyrophosphorylase (carboxylating)